jgi:O-antigen ligase
LFAVAPAILYMLWTSSRLKLISRILLLAALIAIALTLLPHLPQSALGRLETVGTSIASGDLGGRVNLWRMAMAEFLTHPLVGIGSGAFSSATIAGTYVHNTFLSILTETGMIGFVLFAVMLAIVTYQALRQPKESSRLWGCVLLVWAVAAVSLTFELKKATWLFLSFIVISASLPSMRRRTEEGSDCVSHARGLSDVLHNPAPSAVGPNTR